MYVYRTAAHLLARDPRARGAPRPWSARDPRRAGRRGHGDREPLVAHGGQVVLRLLGSFSRRLLLLLLLLLLVVVAAIMCVSAGVGLAVSRPLVRCGCALAARARQAVRAAAATPLPAWLRTRRQGRRPSRG